MGGILYAQRLLRVGIDPWMEIYANWNRYIPGSNWNTAGAAGSGTDYTSTGQATATVPSSYGWVNWDVTDQVKAAQTADVDIAFRITAPGLETQNIMVWFYSREYTDASYRPRLFINYIPPSAPVVGTIGADNVTYDSATCWGKIINEGTATPTIRGFKYGLGQTDTWDTHQNGSFGTGDYSLNLINLIPDSTYYFRAYATNTYGTSYGSWESFSTGTGAPIVSTGSAYVYGYGSCFYASMGGTITSIGDATVTRRGFEWGTNPITPEYDLYENGSFGVGNYTLSDFCGLNLTYWFRAYATNSEGTGYGIWKKFGTPEAPSDSCSGGGGANVTGAGTVGDPYIIWSDYGLQDMQSHLGSYWELGCSINATGTSSWNAGAGFAPVSTFTGHFDGNNHTIDGLYINRGTSEVGLFGKATGATITNVTLTDFDITGAGTVGGLVGYAYQNNNITYCHAGTSSKPGVITSSSTYAGGLIGQISAFYSTEYTYVTYCSAYADVTGVVTCSGYGGLIGSCIKAAVVSKSYACGTVQAGCGAGGLVGIAAGSSGNTVSNCYARVHVVGIDYGFPYITQSIGGFSGGIPCNPTNCYSTGLVECLDPYPGCITVGGFAGQAAGGCTACFWDVSTSGWGTSACGTGKVTAEMTVNSTFIDAGWNFTTIWGMDSAINDGYPYLQWALTTPSEDVTTYTLTLSSTSGGNVTDPGEGDFDYSYGTVVSLNATADGGYRFAMWVGDVSEIADTRSATTTVTVTDDFEIIAVFVPEGKLALYIDSTDGGDVTDPGEGLFSYNASEVVDLVATAEGGYLFVMWTGDTDEIVDIYSDNTTIEMLDDYAITANFATSGLYALIISSTEGGEVLDPGEGLFEYSPSTVVNLTAQPNPGAWFVEWTGDDVTTIDDVYNPVTNITMSSNYSIVAEFGMPGSFGLTIISSVGGNVTDPGEGTFVYDASTVVDLLAVADEGYEFFAWTGDTGTLDDAVNEDTTITMNGDYVIVANFEATEECSLLLGLAATEGGNITAPGEGAFTFPCGSLVTITAEAYSGWWFKEWTRDIESVANPLSFNTTILMVDDYSITANFVEEKSPPVGAPNVTTLAATSIASSSAWLNGSLDSLGNYTQGYVFFQYGTTTTYGTNTREQLRTATGNFSSWINNLATNATYHYRAACRYGSYVYGADGNFTTLGGEVCADCLWAGIEPYESLMVGDDDLAMIYGANWYGQTFTVDTESHSAVDVRLLVYRVGTPSTITVSIRECGANGLPTGDDLTSGTFDGDSVTNSTGGSWYGTTLTEMGLAYGETYAICVRAEAGDVGNYLAMRVDTSNGYSGGQAITSGSGGIIWTADTGNDAMFQIYGRALIRVLEAKVFNSYLEDGDALIVLSYLNTYVPYYPDKIASLHFWLQLRTSNGDTVLSQTVCQQWGYMPGSIYLNANQAASLTNGWPYRIYLAGTSSERPVACYILQPDDWLGDALHLLCPWVIGTANSMATYYGTAMTAQVQNKEVLNSEGGTLFATGIPSLIISDPECFQDISYIPDTDTITPGPTDFDTSTTWEIQVGPVVASLANGVGGVFGDISGKYIIAAIFFVIYLAICYLVVRAKADPIIATFLCVPILLGVADLRVIDFQLIAAIGAVAVIMTVYRFHWSRT